MSDATTPAQPSATAGSDETVPADANDVIELHRRTIDKILVSFGALTTVVFLVAGGLLLWGANFSADYVHRELGSQNVFFPSAEELKAEGRDDLVGHAGQQVTTGAQAEAYASYIGGHLEGIADGKTYSEIDDRGAAAAVQKAIDSGASDEEVAKLQATADQLKAQRDTLFKGETLRGLLLSSYAWSTVGRIAGYAAIAAFAAAVAMGALTIAGLVHLRRRS
ncbi:MAG TPA: hypothetical protein VNQ33_02230 [Acidimicrobiales bacterium]|nr:hypothetical protein [Acidimicrobiales bacterium]